MSSDHPDNGPIDMDDFWDAFEEAQFRAARSPGWPACCSVLAVANEHQNMMLAGEILKLQGILIMQELWKGAILPPGQGR